MNFKLSVRGIAAMLLVGSVALGGCARQPALYQWGNYQPQLREHFNGGSPQAQLDVLNADLQKIQAKNGAVPPGFYAQMGLLYSSLGDDELTMRSFEKEKALFPESAQYMDFLMKKKTGEGK
jgi:hypothetical protein